MRNEAVRRECVKLLKRFLSGPRPSEPMAIGYKLVRAGATNEDLPAIWRDVVSEIGGDGADGECLPAWESGRDESDALRALFAEYQTLIEGSGTRPHASALAPRRAEDAGPLRVRV